MISVGWNAMPPGFDNEPEYEQEDGSAKTRPEVVHAERNAMDKLSRQGIPAENSLLFITHAPCLECAKSIHAMGFKQVVFRNSYRAPDGLQYLHQAGVTVIKD